MTKEDVVALIAEKTGCTKLAASVAFEAVIDEITSSIVRDGYAKIHRLCSFTLIDRAPRIARNLHTGEALQVAARKVVRIKPLQALRDAVEH